MASWQQGLFKINKESREVTQYNGENSPLKSEHSLGYIFVSGLAVDKQNNLWMAQTAVVDFIKVKDLKSKEEKWYSFNMRDLIKKIPDAIAEHILVDSRNYKWITFPRSNQLIVFFENGSFENTSVHKIAEIDLTSQVYVAGTRITCIAEDREGRIWTGSDQGIKVIYDAASVFNRKLYAKNIFIQQKTDESDTAYTQSLLELEYITCIAVDAANRKWIGTRNAGIFLVSPSGTEELFHFTTNNSPLFSNQINDIIINHENGEVFIATEEGLISYKGTATAGRGDYKDVLVYPNPVRGDYYGPVAVKGLMEDSFCKITDAAGNLVWQGIAYGGQLIWNGKDFYGHRPATGVYFVMASSKTGKEKKVAKFLFIQ
jgi:ligand-binding sensor domain-containing protein